MENSTITILYKIKGTIDQGHINEFFGQLAAIAKEGRIINLVLEMDQVDALRNLNNFLSDENWKGKALKNLRKFALIADSDWISELGDFIEFLNLDLDVDVFDYEEREKANVWVQASTKQEDRDLMERVKQGYAHLLDIV
jgi:hypothetical protein